MRFIHDATQTAVLIGPLWLARFRFPLRWRVFTERQGFTYDSGGGGVTYLLNIGPFQLAISRELARRGTPTKHYPGALWLHYQDARAALVRIGAQPCACPTAPSIHRGQCPHALALQRLAELGEFPLREG
jgi:hypothetical protein